MRGGGEIGGNSGELGRGGRGVAGLGRSEGGKVGEWFGREGGCPGCGVGVREVLGRLIVCFGLWRSGLFGRVSGFTCRDV